MIPLVLALVGLLSACARLPNPDADPQTVTYKVYGAVSGNVTVTVATELDGVWTPAAIAPASLPWEHQTGYSADVSYYVRVQVDPVIEAAGTATSVTSQRLVDSGAAFVAAVQENDFVYNVDTQETTIVDLVADNQTLDIGDHIFTAVGEAYTIYDRQSIGATIVLRCADGTELFYDDSRDAGVVDFRLDLP